MQTNLYRSHYCGELTTENIGEKVIISGWVHAKRDHGGVVFLDLRDQKGLIQIVTDDKEENSVKTELLEKIPNESVVKITGLVRERKNQVERSDIATGKIEVLALQVETLSKALNQLPFNVNEDSACKESVRLKYRFLDLRRAEMQKVMALRSNLFQWVRNKFHGMEFQEYTTPILTSSSPEGAKDFLVASRLNPGKFYALPQAPQQFKQLLMASGVDKYFQISPCFRDEDARADRTPGEFYQLDVEMAFVEQEDLLQLMEGVMTELFQTFSTKKVPQKFTRISFNDAMLKYGSDKPDLRNPLVISDVTSIFADSDLSMFVKAIKGGAVMRAIPSPNSAEKPRSFFDGMMKFAQENGAKGLAYIIFDKKEGAKGPIAKLLSEDKIAQIKQTAGLNDGDAVFLSCDKEKVAAHIAGLVRNKIGEDLELLDKSEFKFCWVTDFMYFEEEKDTGKVDFGHNPFSMPILKNNQFAESKEELLQTLAYQYDLVCDGIELASGAIRNHMNELLVKAFEVVGYDPKDVAKNFEAMINAFKMGIPPHGGIAFGMERILMLLANKESIREVIAFPTNNQAQDLMMNAPSVVDKSRIVEISEYVQKAFDIESEGGEQ